MALGGLHIMVRILEDIVLIEIGGSHRARCIDAAPPPDGLVVVLYDHALMRVKRPAIVSAQPGHVGWVDNNQAVNIFIRHRLPCPGEATVVFILSEV